MKHPQVLTFNSSQRYKLSPSISASTFLFLSLRNVKCSQLGLTLPTNATLFCWQCTDGGACLQALPRDLHDALIIKIFDRHEVSDSSDLLSPFMCTELSLAFFQWIL